MSKRECSDCAFGPKKIKCRLRMTCYDNGLNRNWEPLTADPTSRTSATLLGDKANLMISIDEVIDIIKVRVGLYQHCKDIRTPGANNYNKGYYQGLKHIKEVFLEMKQKMTDELNLPGT